MQRNPTAACLQSAPHFFNAIGRKQTFAEKSWGTFGEGVARLLNPPHAPRDVLSALEKAPHSIEIFVRIELITKVVAESAASPLDALDGWVGFQAGYKAAKIVETVPSGRTLCRFWLRRQPPLSIVHNLTYGAHT